MTLNSLFGLDLATPLNLLTRFSQPAMEDVGIQAKASQALNRRLEVNAANEKLH